MYEFRYAKEHAIARTSHKAFRLIEKYLLFGLMVAIALKAQQSSPSAPAWADAVRRPDKIGQADTRLSKK